MTVRERAQAALIAQQEVAAEDLRDDSKKQALGRVLTDLRQDISQTIDIAKTFAANDMDNDLWVNLHKLREKANKVREKLLGESSTNKKEKCDTIVHSFLESVQPGGMSPVTKAAHVCSLSHEPINRATIVGSVPESIAVTTAQSDGSLTNFTGLRTPSS
jgi:hypothetical protein